LAWLDFFI